MLSFYKSHLLPVCVNLPCKGVSVALFTFTDSSDEYFCFRSCLVLTVLARLLQFSVPAVRICFFFTFFVCSEMTN